MSVRRGFSTIEIIIALAIFSGLLFVTAGLRGNVATLQNLINQKLQSRQDLDQTFQIMVTEIRSAGPSALGGYAIESVGTSSLVFYSDIDGDSVVDRVRYFFSGTSTIQRGVIVPSGNPIAYATSSETITTVVENIVVSTSTDIFTYYDATYTGSGNPMSYPIAIQDIRTIRISVYADVKPSVAPKPFFFTNTVTVRNLRSN